MSDPEFEIPDRASRRPRDQAHTRAFAGLLVAALCLAMPARAANAAFEPQAGSAATIVVPPGAGAQRRASAALLRDYLRRSLSQDFPIAERAGGGLAFHVGRSAQVDKLGLRLEQLDDDGYVLQLVDDQNYVIAGPTEWGTEFGVLAFLEQIVGVRWLLPGPVGTDVPANKTLSLNREAIREQPAFFSRQITGLDGPVQEEWGRRLRVHLRVEFHHNLKELFPPSLYARAHPEFFAQIGGKRLIPSSDAEYDWQPDFSAPGIVEEAVRRIRAHFRAHPEQRSYSLGINDSTRFDESRLRGAEARRNFLQQRDVSDEYYRWCNAVIEGVLAEFPDKWFGCLAYNNVIEPPTGFRLHPRLIPYICYDRLKWSDETERLAGERLQARWQAAASQTGWYDYYYGTPYCLPRVYSHELARALRYARARGVVAQKAEAYPNWGEGPKLYAAMKLWWNPDCDVDALLTDWYERCVGKDAAPLLREHYDVWERFWTQTLPAADWFRAPGQYQAFYALDYLHAVDEADIRRSRALLDQAVARAQTPAQRERAALLRRAFEYYAASALAYRGDLPDAQPIIDSGADARAALDDALERMTLTQRRLDHVRDVRSHPLLRMPLGIERFPNLDGRDWSQTTLWRLFDAARADAGVRGRIASLRASPIPRIAEQSQQFLDALEQPAPIRSLNASFEDGAAPWMLWVERSQGSMRVVGDFAHTGRSSVLCEGVAQGGPNQKVNVTPGRYLARARVFAAPGAPAGASVALAPILRGADDRNLPTPRTIVRPPPGRWIELACPLDVPRAVDGKPVTHVLLVLIVSDCVGGRIYVDDLSLERR